jgi:hypothetical protein
LDAEAIVFEGAGRQAGPVIPWAGRDRHSLGQGSKAPMIKVQSKLVVEVATDAALQAGHFRTLRSSTGCERSCGQKTSRYLLMTMMRGDGHEVVG